MAEQSGKTFFSYSRTDSEFTLRLVRDLRAAGASVWLDQLDVKPGEHWDSAVENALEACPIQLIVLSPDAVGSENVMDEVSFALEERKRIIPVLYRDCHIPFRLRRVQYIDFRNDYQSAMQQLLTVLTSGEQVASAENSSESTSSVASTERAPQRDVDKPFLMSIEDVFWISGRGTVVTGKIERGKIKVEDEVEIVGFRETRKTVVVGIEMYRKLLDEASAGDDVGILLRGIGKDEVQHGMVLAKPGSITSHTRFKAEVHMLTRAEGGRHAAIFNGYRPFFYFRTTEVPGVAELPQGTERVMPGENVTLTIELNTPMALEKGLRFAVREDGETVGAGTISEILR